MLRRRAVRRVRVPRGRAARSPRSAWIDATADQHQRPAVERRLASDEVRTVMPRSGEQRRDGARRPWARTARSGASSGVTSVTRTGSAAASFAGEPPSSARARRSAVARPLGREDERDRAGRGLRSGRPAAFAAPARRDAPRKVSAPGNGFTRHGARWRSPGRRTAARVPDAVRPRRSSASTSITDVPDEVAVSLVATMSARSNTCAPARVRTPRRR